VHRENVDGLYREVGLGVGGVIAGPLKLAEQAFGLLVVLFEHDDRIG